MATNKMQDEFINSYGKNVLLNASAGSGKTHTMIQKLVSILSSKDKNIACGPQNLMVVTFTKNAANEMRDRLISELIKNNCDESILDKVANADIGTIDSIGNKLISKYFYAINIDRNSRIIEGSEKDYLFLSSLEKVLKNYEKSGDTQYLELYKFFEQNRSNKNLSRAICDLYAFLDTKVDWDSYISYMLENFEKPYETSEQVIFVDTYYREYLSQISAKIHGLQRNCIDLGLDTCSATLGQMCGIIDEILGQEVIGRDSTISYKVPNPLKQKGKEEFEEVFEQVKDYVEEFNKLMSELSLAVEQKSVYDNYKSQYLSIVNKLIEVTKATRLEYTALKKKMSLMDFVDIEQNCAKLFDIENVKKEIKENYKYIFIDEYQDFTDIQEYIITSASRGNNIYMIGDVKQSIYGFRNCTPKIFLDKVNKYSVDEACGTVIPLNYNYRSMEGILEFVNYIFRIIMTKQNSGMEYDKSNSLVGALESQKNPSEITLDIVKADELDSEDVIKVEAKRVVKLIQESINKKYFDIKANKYRNIDYSDIAVLVRKRKYNEILYEELVKANIPVTVDFEVNIFGTYEVSLIYNILKCIANDKNDIPFVNYLHSPIVNMSEDEFVIIKTKSQGDTFYARAKNYIEQDTIREKLELAYDRLAHFRDYLSHHTVYELVTYILEQYDLVNILIADRADIKVESNINSFLELIKGINSGNIYKVLSYLKLVEDSEGVDVQISTATNAVSIMTMHRSKGLEWPVVIIPYLESKSREESKQSIVIHDKYGVGINYRNYESKTYQKSIYFSASSIAKDMDEYAESIRLLYVALTRSKQNLHLIGSVKEKGLLTAIKQFKLTHSNYLNMILSCLGKKFLSRLLVTGGEELKISDTASLSVNFINETLEENTEPNQEVESSVDNEILREIGSVLSFKYPYAFDTTITLKNSVSNILTAADDYTSHIYMPQRFDISEGDNKKSKSNILGSAYHNLIEYLLINRNVDVMTAIDVLLSKNIIDDDIKSDIDVDMIEVARRDILSLIGTNSFDIEAKFMMKVPHSSIVESSSSDSLILVQGICDLIIHTKEGEILVDFKTNKLPCEDIKSKYRIQLDLYSRAIELAGKKVLSKKIYSTFNHKWIEM